MSGVGQLHIDHRQQDGRDTLALAGELDLRTAPELDVALLRLCTRGAREIVLDLRELDFMDSTGLHAVFRGRDVCRDHDCTLLLTEGRPAVQRLLDLTGASDKLTFADRTVDSHPARARDDDALGPELEQ